MTARPAEASWRRAVEPYLGSDARRSAFQTVTTLAPLVATFAFTHAARRWPLAAAVPAILAAELLTAGLLIRTFVLMHDCAHGSFFASRRLNDAVGFITGVLTLTPFAQWRRDHALHHATSGDLDRRGHDIPTLTVREYERRTPRARRVYRLMRHPLALLLGGPIHLMVLQRWRPHGKASGRMQAASMWMTNLASGSLLGIAVLAAGWRSMVLAFAIPYYAAAAAGVWLFYVQHQFEDAYWSRHGEWDYFDAAVRGSSHLRLSPVLAWFTADIGLHHVHHAAPRIPNYRLRRCHDENAMFHVAPVLTLRSGTAALRLALWDEDRGRLVRFSDLSVGDRR